jgi:hypothetical protein
MNTKRIHIELNSDQKERVLLQEAAITKKYISVIEYVPNGIFVILDNNEFSRLRKNAYDQERSMPACYLSLATPCFKSRYKMKDIYHHFGA